MKREKLKNHFLRATGSLELQDRNTQTEYYPKAERVTIMHT